MLSGVLNSPVAVQVNVLIVREFIRLRSVLNSNTELEKRMSELEAKSDSKFRIVFEAIRKLMSEQTSPRKQVIGLTED